MILDDVYYLLNKSIFFDHVLPIAKTYQSGESDITSFDQAYSWHQNHTFGKEAVLKNYERKEKSSAPDLLTDQERQTFQENIDENLVTTVSSNPNIQFYYFFTPYSILYWDSLQQSNSIEKHMLGERMIIESLLPYDNVHFFSFSNDFDITTDLSHYKDITHYSEDFNTLMLKRMAKEENRLTKDNYEQYLKEVEQFYLNYNYQNIIQ